MPWQGASLSVLLLCAAASSAGCSFNWTDGPPPRPLVGAPADLSTLPKLNRTPSGTVNLISGADARETWAAFCEIWRQGPYGQRRGCTGLRLVRVAGGAPVEEFLEADEIGLRSSAVYLLGERPGGSTRTLQIHRAGRTTDKVFQFPRGPAVLRINDGGRDDSFVYWVLDARTTTFAVRREEGGVPFDLPIPEGADPATGDKARFFFAANGETLVVQDAKGNLDAWATGQPGASWPLGRRLGLLALDQSRPPNFLLSLEKEGLFSVPIDGAREVNLTPVGKSGESDPPWDPADPRPASGPLDTNFLQLSLKEAYIRRGPQGAVELYRVPLDGSALPRRIGDGSARVIALPPGYPADPRVAISRDPGSLYAGGAGDLWVDGFRAAERGRLGLFSRDAERLFFLEFAAHAGTYGELRSVTLPTPGGGPGGTPLTLGLNVRQFSELPDGRVLAVENHVQTGSWNRLVVIDVDGQGNPTARFLTAATHEYALLPGRTEAIVDVVSGASGYDLYRVSIPAR